MLPRSSWGTLLLAYKLVLGDGRPAFVRLMKWPFLALMLAMICQILSTAAGEPAADGSIALPSLVQAGNLLLLLAAAVVALGGMTGWARWVIDPSAPVRFQWRREELVTLGRLVQVYLLAMLAAALAAVAVYMVLSLALTSSDAPSFSAGGGMPIAMDSDGLMAAGPVLAGLAAFAAVFVRYSLSPVAATAGHSSGLATAATASRPRRWHIFWTLMLFIPTALAATLPLLVLALMLATVLASVAASPFMLSIWVNLILMLFYIPLVLGLYGVFVALFAIYYRWLALAERSE